MQTNDELDDHAITISMSEYNALTEEVQVSRRKIRELVRVNHRLRAKLGLGRIMLEQLRGIYENWRGGTVEGVGV